MIGDRWGGQAGFTRLAVTEVKYSYRVNMLGTLSMQSRLVSLTHSRTPFTPFSTARSIPLTRHSPRHSPQRDGQMHRRGLQNRGLRDGLKYQRRLGTDGGANEHANVGTRPDHPYSPFQPFRVRASAHRRSAPLCLRCMPRACSRTQRRSRLEIESGGVWVRVPIKTVCLSVRPPQPPTRSAHGPAFK